MPKHIYFYSLLTQLSHAIIIAGKISISISSQMKQVSSYAWVSLGECQREGGKNTRYLLYHTDTYSNVVVYRQTDRPSNWRKQWKWKGRLLKATIAITRSVNLSSIASRRFFQKWFQFQECDEILMRISPFDCIWDHCSWVFVLQFVIRYFHPFSSFLL